jgi:hypothetical protein
MGKASASKKVARAARTGGGRTRSGGQRSYLFPGLLSVVVVVGIVLIGFSRQQRQPDTSPPRPGDHWHSAIGFNICGEFAPDIPDNGLDPLGIHSHGDGIVHTHPFSNLAAGSRATLSLFFDTLGLNVTSDEIEVPGAEAKRNGDLCDGRPGRVQTKVWETRSASDPGRIVTGDPGDIKLGNNQLITVAFLPEGADIPKPPSEPQLDRLTDIPGATTTPTTVAEEPTTTAPEETTTVPPTTAAP